MSPNDIAARADRVCCVVEFRPWPAANSSLIGQASLSLPGWMINRIPVFRRADGSVGTPSAPRDRRLRPCSGTRREANYIPGRRRGARPVAVLNPAPLSAANIGGGQP
jgi:hypothetical protein